MMISIRYLRLMAWVLSKLWRASPGAMLLSVLQVFGSALREASGHAGTRVIKRRFVTSFAEGRNDARDSSKVSRPASQHQWS